MNLSMFTRIVLAISMSLSLTACDSEDSVNGPTKLAEGVFAIQGEARPNLTDAEQALFTAGCCD